ncbi:Lar family restriction alleviation protein [Camelimonas sp. ID_303_24]
MPRIAKPKPCPFCRSEATFVECLDYGSFAMICNDCGARGPQADGDGCDPEAESHRGERGAIRAWNKRKRGDGAPA